VTVADVRGRGVTGSPRFLQTAVEGLAREGQRVNVVMLSPSRLVTISSHDAAMQRLLAALDDVADARVVRDAAIVAAVGEGIAGHAPVWSLLTAAADSRHVESVVATQSGHALVCITTRDIASRLLSQLHDTFFEPVHA
jgi:aspartokinase